MSHDCKRFSGVDLMLVDKPTTGCDDRRPTELGRPLGYKSRLVDQESVKSAFTFSYFDAQIGLCSSRRTPYLVDYDEDFSKTSLEDEWGKRTWVSNPLTTERRDLILAALATNTLDFSDFRGECWSNN